MSLVYIFKEHHAGLSAGWLQINLCVRVFYTSEAVVPGTGGASRDRTDDPLLAKQVLSQLSYGPMPSKSVALKSVVVGLGGLEPPASPLSGVRSNHLSYRPISFPV